MCARAVKDGSLLGNGELQPIFGITRIVFAQERPDTRIFDFFVFFRFRFAHVIHGTEFLAAHVTSRRTACKDERQINRKLRFGSGRRT